MINLLDNSTSTINAQNSVHLKEMMYKIDRYCGIILFFTGIIGNILNIIILSHRSLRSNTCVIIFISSSISGIITIFTGLISRITAIWTHDLTDSVQWLCKLRAFILYTFRLITFWLIMLATIDRWIVSSRNARLRRLSSKKNVFWSILFTGILSVIIHLQIFYCHKANLKDTPLKCFNKDMDCQLVNDLIFAIVAILTPLIFIAIFGWMTILNIRSSQSRLDPLTKVTVINGSSPIAQPQQQSKRKDQTVFLMLLVQVILLACLTLPMAIYKLYLTFTFHVSDKSEYRRTTEELIYRIALTMTFIANGMQFYVNTLSGGRVFRKVLVDLVQLMVKKIKFW